MELHTQALEVVCRHYKAEYESIHIKSLRMRLNRAYKRTAAAKKEALRAKALAKHLHNSHQEIMRRIRDILADLLESCVVGDVWIDCAISGWLCMYSQIDYACALRLIMHVLAGCLCMYFQIDYAYSVYYALSGWLCMYSHVAYACTFKLIMHMIWILCILCILSKYAYIRNVHRSPP